MVLFIIAGHSESTFTLCLQVTVECLDEGRLVLYPQILLACFALLGTSYVHLWGLLLDLLSKVGQPHGTSKGNPAWGVLCDRCSCRAGHLQWVLNPKPQILGRPAWGAGSCCVTGRLHQSALIDPVMKYEMLWSSTQQIIEPSMTVHLHIPTQCHYSQNSCSAC